MHSEASPCSLPIFFLLSYSGIVIPGSRTPSRVDENTAAGEVKISPEDMAAIRKVVDEADVAGVRYTTIFLDQLDGESLPLSEWKV